LLQQASMSKKEARRMGTAAIIFAGRPGRRDFSMPCVRDTRAVRCLTGGPRQKHKVESCLAASLLSL